MGASSTKPRTAQMVNNTPPPQPIDITPKVLERLENVHSNGKDKQKVSDMATETKAPPVQAVPIKQQQATQPSALQVRSNELENMQYVSTLARLESVIGKPVNWSEKYAKEMKSMQKQLQQCYSDNPSQSLRCAELAQEYQNFVFAKQFTTILNSDAPEKQ